MKRWPIACVLVLGVVGLAWPAGRQHRMFKTEALLQMLDTVQADIKNNYYDPSMHGIDLDATFEKARKEIAAARSVDEALLDIAQAVAVLNDSHTHFSPPIRAYDIDYGWRMEAIGDSGCFATAVRLDSDALAKGLRAGDQILSINGVPLTRQDIGFTQYAYSVIPHPGLRLLVRSPDGTERNLVIMARLLPSQAIVRHSPGTTWLRNYHGAGDRSQYFQRDNVLFWRMPDFLLPPSTVDAMLDRILPFRTIVLDLRGNTGGLNETLDRFVGGFFGRDVKVAEFKGRQQSRQEIARSRKERAFRGKLIVLVDSETSSAAEVFARLVQLEKRGIVLGDRSRGAVMQGQVYQHTVQLNAATVARYGVEISTADVIMSDGKSLEHVGVIPDEKILPSVTDIAQGNDPVLARAAELAGLKMIPPNSVNVLRAALGE